jgi:amidohydrolase
VPRLDLDADLRELTPKLREIRQDIHQHPELGFEEHRTQRLVQQWLEGLGYEPRTCADTGLIADLHPERASEGTIALRADLDALPMHEETDLAYKSQTPGVAHKCGHDGHTAILLGVSALLRRHAEHIDRNVRLLFQPAEEGVDGGGARRMVAQGALDDVSEVYGLHNWPGFPKGQVRVRRGPTMAQVYEFETLIRGKGGHGSQPQVCRDPIVAGAALVSSLQTLVSRAIGSADNAVVSVGAFNAGEANNVIPSNALIRGTIRCFDAQVGARIAKRFEEICEGIALAHEVSISPGLESGYPVLVNEDSCAERVRRVAAELLGDRQVHDAGLPLAASEDFAYFTRERPGAYFFLGAGSGTPDAPTPGCHHPDFDFDDDLLGLGMRMFMGIVTDPARA